MESFMKRICEQTAVYWGTPVKDGQGGFTYDAPAEIDCRWEKRTEVVSSLGGGRKGTEFVSKALVWVMQDVDEQGYLYLGGLDDLSSTLEENPEEVDKAYRIERFDKIPAVRHGTEFIRKAYL